MEFKKVHEIELRKSFIISSPLNNLKSNFTSSNVRIKDGKLFISEKKFPLEKYDNLFTITENFHILFSPSNNYHILIDLSKKPSRVKVDGRPIHISKTGYICTFDKLTPYRKEIFYRHYNLVKDEMSEQKFVCDSFKREDFINNAYTIYHSSGNHNRVHVYTIEEYILNDFEKKNPDFPSIWEHYFYHQPSDCQKSGLITVNFRDCIKTLTFEKLFALKSSFVNDQINSGEEIYLDSEYSGFENKTFEFLRYIKSHLLTQFFQLQVKRHVENEFNAFLLQKIDFRSQFEECFEDFISKI